MCFWPENGGYLVVGPDTAPAINPTLYAYLFKPMIGCTFPVTGNAEISKKLCPGYSPKKQGKHALVKAFSDLGCRFIFLPRAFYGLLYHVFITEIEKPILETRSLSQLKLQHSPQLEKPEQLENEDGKMYLASRESSVWKYFEDVIEEQLSFSFHYAHFNAWAVALLTHPDHAVLKLSKLLTDEINELDAKDQLFPAALSLLKRVKHKHPKELALAVCSLFFLETKNPKYTFLTRFGESTSGIEIANKEESKYTGETYSQSFGADLFAGFFGDLHANTLSSIGGRKSIFVIPILIDDYKNQVNEAACFWIPPYPTPCQCYCDMNELWHPRSRILVRSDIGREKQKVHGIGDYSLRKIHDQILTMPWIWYFKELTLEEISELSIYMEKYISKHAIVLVQGK